MAFTATPQSPLCPAQSWYVPAACWISSEITERMALPMILRLTSPTPVGLTLGHLLSTTRWLAVKACIGCGSIGPLAGLLAVLARASHSSFDDPLNEQQMRCHAVASKPEGLWLPLVLKAAALMEEASITSKQYWVEWYSFIGRRVRG